MGRHDVGHRRREKYLTTLATANATLIIVGALVLVALMIAGMGANNFSGFLIVALIVWACRRRKPKQSSS